MAAPAKKTPAAKEKAPPRTVPATNSLADAIGGIMADVGAEEDLISYRPVQTGINVLDYYNGRYFYNYDSEEYVPFTGLPIGKEIGIIGDTGAGKTTLLVQCAMALVAPYDDGVVYHIDLENAWSRERTADISGMSMDVVKVKYKKLKPLGLESMYEFIKRIIEIKKANIAKGLWMVTNVITGERMPVPTVVLIDTVAAIQTDEILGTKTAMGSALAEPGMQAKLNNMFAQRLAGIIGDVNITVMWVNHIRTSLPAVGPIQTRKRVQYLNKDESVPGGAGFPQYADYYLKMVPVESLTNAEGGYGINGKVVRCTIIKSRLSYDGRQFELILTDSGFSNAWTNLHFLKAQKAVEGAGAHMFLSWKDPATGEVHATRKFAFSQWAKLYESTTDAAVPSFRQIADNILSDLLHGLMPQPGTPDEAGILEVADDVVAAELESVLEGLEAA
jgi:RecA/RadA recombinase